MPMYLKKSTIRLLEASVESISLAVTAIGLPQRYEMRDSTSKTAAAIGLTGTSAELAMSAIIVQASGEQSLKLPSGFYKTGRRIVDDFRMLISSQVPKLLFLTQGIENATEHISKILEASSKFKLLATSRAGGLHAGKGPSRDVCIACINDVIEFIRLLRMSSRIRPYTETIPHTIEMPKSYELIVDDLIQKINHSALDDDKASTLASIYLVIPELPTEEPTWLQAFDRLMVAPKSQDISFLLDTLQRSKYASLIKVAKSSDSIPVYVQKGNPAALPIEPQYLKKSLSDIKDRFYADRGNANGRLDANQFDPPPIESVYEIFAFGLYTLGIIDDENTQLNAVDTWLLIAASLSYTGTSGPYWYFIKKTSDFGQLEQYINRVAKILGKRSGAYFKEFKVGMDALKKSKPLTTREKFVHDLLLEYEQASTKQQNLVSVSKKYIGKDKELCEEAQADLLRVQDEEMHVGEMLIKIAEEKYTFTNVASRKYWTRILCETASEPEDLQGLLAILKTPELNAAHTAVRKAFRVIDFINYGPKTE